MKSRRMALSLVEVLLATAILSTALVVAYGLLQSDYRFGMDLPNRETADILARNMLERYRNMTPEQLLELAGGEGEFDPGALGDKTLDGVDPRDSEELARLGFVRSLQVARRGGPLGGVSFLSRVSWPSVGGRSESFEFGVATFPAQETARAMEKPSGFDPGLKAAGWGRAKTWNRSRPRSASRGSGAGRFGSPGYEERDPAQDYVPSDYVPGSRPRPQLNGVEELGGPDGILAAAIEARQEQSPEERTQAFLQRTVKRPLSAIEIREIPDGEYRYALQALDQGGGSRLGIYEIWGDPGEFLMVARQVGNPPLLKLRGETVLESRSLSDRKGVPWVLYRTVDRIFMLELGKGLMPNRLRLHTPESLGGGQEGTTLSRREIKALLAKLHFEETTEAIPDPLQVALQSETL